ncbi:hypothetical protein HKX48_003612 [Thoreauomyces humboldtii]|nr:hypothetical protein HKX48_003612 [Thoreauomyces humboldtii]
MSVLPSPGNRTIIIGIDSITRSGLQASPILGWAIRQFLVNGDSITVVHASKSLEGGGVTTGNANVMSPELLKSLEKDVESTVRDMCRNAIPRVGDIKVKAVVAKGDPRETIKNLAHELNPTAVIVGRRGSVGAVKRALLGSVSDYLCKELSATVIIVKGD